MAAKGKKTPECSLHVRTEEEPGEVKKEVTQEDIFEDGLEDEILESQMKAEGELLKEAKVDDPQMEAIDPLADLADFELGLVVGDYETTVEEALVDE